MDLINTPIQDLLLTEQDLDKIPDLISELENQLHIIDQDLKNDQEYQDLKSSISKIEELIENGRDQICEAQEVLQEPALKSEYSDICENISDREKFSQMEEHLKLVEDLNNLFGQKIVEEFIEEHKFRSKIAAGTTDEDENLVDDGSTIKNFLPGYRASKYKCREIF